MVMIIICVLLFPALTCSGLGYLSGYLYMQKDWGGWIIPVLFLTAISVSIGEVFLFSLCSS